MYINAEELNALERAVNKLQDIIEEQKQGYNSLFVEGTFKAREDANECERFINNVRKREIRARANKIVKNRKTN